MNGQPLNIILHITPVLIIIYQTKKWKISLGFIGGILSSYLVVETNNIISIPYNTELIGAVITFPIVEELTKFLFLIIMFTFLENHLEDNFLITGFALGLGFGFAENSFFHTNK